MKTLSCYIIPIARNVHKKIHPVTQLYKVAVADKNRKKVRIFLASNIVTSFYSNAKARQISMATDQENWTQSFGGLCHVDGTAVAHHLCHEGQGPAMV